MERGEDGHKESGRWHEYSSAELAAASLPPNVPLWQHSPPRPFDPMLCLAQLRRAMPQPAIWRVRWDYDLFTEGWARVEGLLSRAEARFWFEAACHGPRLDDDLHPALRFLDALASSLAAESCPRPPDLDASLAGERLRTFVGRAERQIGRRWDPTQLAFVLQPLSLLVGRGPALGVVANVLPPHALALALTFLPPGSADDEALVEQAARVVAGLDLALPWVRDQIAAPLLCRAPHAPSIEALLGRILQVATTPGPGRDEEVLLAVILALPDEDEALRWLERANIALAPGGVRRFVARFGATRTDGLMRASLVRRPRRELPALLDELERIHAPEMVAGMVQLMGHDEARDRAYRWLMREGPQVLDELLKLADSGRGTLRRRALALLRRARELGQGPQIEARLAERSPALQRRLRARVLHPGVDAGEPQPLSTDRCSPWILQLVARGTTPGEHSRGLMQPGVLPTLLVRVGSRQALPSAAVAGLLELLQEVALVPSRKNGPRQPHQLDLYASLLGPGHPRSGEFDPKLLTCREELDLDSADRFAWRLFASWLGAGAPAAGAWVVAAVGFLGGRRAVTRLVDRIGVHGRWMALEEALVGLEALRLAATPLAIHGLEALARQASHRRVREQARRLVEQMAVVAGQPPQDFLDDHLPRCGLDDQASMQLGVGAWRGDGRQRGVSLRWLGSESAALLIDERGRRWSSLPPARRGDDARAVAEARREHRLALECLERVSGVEAARMEEAMIAGRCWTPGRWRRHVVEHPVGIGLARRLVWCVLDAQGAELATVLPLEDRTLVDVSLESVQLEALAPASIRLAHPVELDTTERAAWARVLMGFGLVQPFEQIGRPVYQPSRAQELLRALETGIVQAEGLDAEALHHVLSVRGWRQRGGDSLDYRRDLFGASAWGGLLLRVEAASGGALRLVSLELERAPPLQLEARRLSEAAREVAGLLEALRSLG